MNVRILIIDDDEDLLFLAQQFLTAQDPDFDLSQVSTGQEALQALDEGRFDAVICDFYLGPDEMNGLEILEWMRERRCNTPFIIFTGRSREEVAIQALNLGADYYLEKGEDLESLFAEIGHHIKNVVRSRRTEEALHESEQRYRTLVQSMNDLIFVLDSKDCFTQYHSISRDDLLAPPEDFIGKHVSDVLPSPVAEPYLELASDVRLDGTRRSFDYELMMDRKKRWYSADLDLHEDGESIVAIVTEITDRKKVENELRVAEREWRYTFDSIPDLVSVLNNEFQILRANKTMAEALGVKPEELVGKKCYEVMHKTSEPFPGCPHLETTKSGLPATAEIHDPCLGVPYTVTTSPIIDEDGEQIGVVHIARDITERVEAEEAIKQSESKFKTLFDNLSDGLVITTAQGIISFCSPRAAEIFKSTPEDIIGTPFSEYVHSDQREEIMRAYKAGLESRIAQPGGYEVRGERKDGSEIYYHITNTIIIENENVMGYQSLIRDITKFKQVESALRESDQKFRQIIETSPMGIHMYELDEKDRLIFAGANPAANQILGLDNRQFIGKRIEEAFPPLASTEIPQRYLDAALNGVTWSTEQITYQDDSISGAFEVHAFQTAPRMMAALFLDITSRKAAEQATARSQENLQTLFNTIDDLLFIVGLDSKLLVTNRRVGQLLGYSKDELRGMNAVNLHPPDRQEEAAKILQEIIEGKTTVCPVPLMTKNGAIIPVETRITLGKWSGEDVLFAVTRDDSHQREIERTLEESEAKYRLLIENIPVVAWTSDEEGNTIYISPNVRDLYGYTQEEIYKSGPSLWFGRIHPEDLSRVQTAYKNSLDTGEGFDVEYRIKKKDGEWIWLHDMSLGTYERDGIRIASGVFSDITKQKKAVEVTRMESDQKAKYLDDVGSFIRIIDKKGHVTLINSKGCEILGYERAEVVGENWFDKFVPRRLRDSLLENFEKGMASRFSEMEEYECPVLTRIGEERIIAWRNVALTDEDGNVSGVLSSGIDVTQMKAAEEASRKQAGELEERIKELTCLYNTLSLLDSAETIEDALKSLVEIMRASWHDPEMTSVRAIYHGKEFKTANHWESPWKLAADILVSGERVGVLEVCYDEEKSIQFEDPFPRGERHLIDALAEYLGNFVRSKKAEEELRKEKEFTETAINAQRDTFFVFDPISGKAVRWNRAFKEICGYSDDEIASMKAPDSYYSQDDLEIATKAIESLMNGGTEIVEMSLKTKAGDSIPFEYMAATILDENDKPKYIVSLGRDVSERKDAERKMEEHVIFLENVLEALSHPFYVIDASNYRIELANNAAKLGPLDQQSTCYCLTHRNETPCSENDHPCPLEEVKKTKKPVIVEHIHFDDSGKRREMEVHAYPVIDERGDVIQMIEYALDVTEHKQALRALEDSEMRFRELFENAPLGYQTLDENAHIINVNQAWLDSLGYVAEEVVGKYFGDFLTIESRSKLASNFGQFKKDGSMDNVEYELIRKGRDHLIARFSGRIAYDEQGSFKQTHCIFQDITEWKLADDLLRRQKEELSELAHVMSHDLGNRMKNIRSLVKLLGREYDESILERIDSIAQQSSELLQASADLADAGMVIEKREKVNLNEVVREIRSTTIPDEVEMEVDELPSVMGSKEKIGQIFQNLFENAIEHGHSTRVEIHLEQSPIGAVIVVTNDGLPIPRDIRHKIFRRGFTTKEKGTGLGLSIVKKLVEAHGWRISLDPEEHTSFRILLGIAF